MSQLDVSFDTREFEVSAELDENMRLTRACTERVCGLLDAHGFAIVPGMLTDAESAMGRGIIRDALVDPDRERSAFASETDTKYGRRDFCPLPSTPSVLSFSGMLCDRALPALAEFCGTTRPILEISTLTSYQGSSHQYLHRDPPGVLCMFAAVDHVSDRQGGTVFAPGTHNYNGAGLQHGGRAHALMRLFQTICNRRILMYNLGRLRQMLRSQQPPMSRREYWDRVFSPRTTDNHQPNLYRFLRCLHPVFDLRHFGPRSLLRLLRHGKTAAAAYRLVQAAPDKGTVILYRSDVLHAGPDNRSERARYFFNLNVSRDVMHPELWRAAYSPHSTLAANPLTLGDLVAGGTLATASSQGRGAPEPTGTRIRQSAAIDYQPDR